MTNDNKILSEKEISQVTGGLVFLIPPAVGFAAKVTGVSLGIVAGGTVTAFGLVSAYKAIFSEGER